MARVLFCVVVASVLLAEPLYGQQAVIDVRRNGTISGTVDNVPLGDVLRSLSQKLPLDIRGPYGDSDPHVGQVGSGEVIFNDWGYGLVDHIANRAALEVQAYGASVRNSFRLGLSSLPLDAQRSNLDYWTSRVSPRVP